MKKFLTITLFSVFAFSFVAGILATTVKAKPPTACEYRCVEQDWYLCCLTPTGEVCTFIHYTCE